MRRTGNGRGETTVGPLKLRLLVCAALATGACAVDSGPTADRENEPGWSSLRGDPGSQSATLDQGSTAFDIAAASNGFRAHHPIQGLVSEFRESGVRFTHADPLVGSPANLANQPVGDWETRLRFVRYGCPTELSRLKEVAPQALGNHVAYRRESEAAPDISVVEWYAHVPQGLEQGFTLSRAPSCLAGDGTLELEIDVTGDLHPAVVSSGDAELRTNSGAVVLHYSGLHAFNASGEELPAKLAERDGTIAIRVAAREVDFPVTIDPLVGLPQAKLETVGAVDDSFGATVAVDGNTTLVGAFGDDEIDFDSGAAYVYVRSGADWTQQAKVMASDGSGVAHFGYSLSVHGDTLVAGAPGDERGAGSAYVFVREGTTWSEQAKLRSSDAVDRDRFGHAVSVSGDVIVVGAPGVDGAGLESGAAYVFTRTGTTWSQGQTLVPSDTMGSLAFGRSVSASGDLVVVGAPSDDQTDNVPGAAYVFANNSTAWVEEAKLLPSNGAAGDDFGYSVSVSGETALVGARFGAGIVDQSGAAYVFGRDSAWSEQGRLFASNGELGDRFGHSVAMGGDKAVIGAVFGDGAATDSGSAHLFARGAATWEEQTALTTPDVPGDDVFGWSVAVSGMTAVVGSFVLDDKGPFAGAAHVFTLEIRLENGATCTRDAECAGGRCSGGACCEGEACDSGDSAPGEDEGCGCRAAPARGSLGSCMGALACAALGLCVQRRRAKRRG